MINRHFFTSQVVLHFSLIDPSTNQLYLLIFDVLPKLFIKTKYTKGYTFYVCMCVYIYIYKKTLAEAIGSRTDTFCSGAEDQGHNSLTAIAEDTDKIQVEQQRVFK